MLPTGCIGLSIAWSPTLKLGLLVQLLASFALAEAAVCPGACKCSWDGQDAMCQNSNLVAVPAALPANLSTLILNNNQLQGTALSGQLDKFSQVYKIDLGNNNIHSILPNMVSSLSNLHYLNLTSNQITTVGENSFINLEQLEILDLSNNKLRQLDNTLSNGIIHLKFLNLSGNILEEIHHMAFHNLQEIRVLDLSFNDLIILEQSTFKGLHALEELYLQWNHIADSFDILGQWSLSIPSVLYIDISHNVIGTQENITQQSFHVLQVLDISYNDITALPVGMFTNCSQLRELNLGNNPLVNLTEGAFQDAPLLEVLYLDNCSTLETIPEKLFTSLDSLKYLNVSNNPLLGYLPSSLFKNLGSLKVLDISKNNLTSLPQATFQTNHNLQQLYLNENPFTCDCAISWVLKLMNLNDTVQTEELSIENPETVICIDPIKSNPLQLQEMKEDNLACEAPVLLSNYTHVYQTIGSSAFLTCDVYSIPPSVITWTTPRHGSLTYHNHHPKAVSHLPSREDVQPGASFHKNHPWHQSNSYYSEIPTSERVLLLDDGTLYIDYVQRQDGGPYSCVIEHPNGNITMMVTLHLDHSVIQNIKIMSIAIGLTSAVSFFAIAMALWGIKVAANRCINQRKRQAIKNIIDNIDAYKTQQIGRIKEMGANQMGKFRDQYHYQLERLRENYNQQMLRIRENCVQQMEKIRDNYATHVGRIKDYSSNRLERLRDNYNTQIVRIREYGSLQLERLRENYKLQQQHLIKILETMNFDSCKTVIETDCVRAESMLFDSEVLIEPIGDLPYLLETDPPSSGRDSNSELEYVTASSNSETTSNTIDTCNSVKDNENQPYTVNEMQLVPGVVIQMPPEISPEDPVSMPDEMLLPPAPILTIPSPRNAVESDSHSETENLPAERQKKRKRKAKRSKQHAKGIEKSLKVEVETLLPDPTPRPSQNPSSQLLTGDNSDRHHPTGLTPDICDSSSQLSQESATCIYGPERESIV